MSEKETKPSIQTSETLPSKWPGAFGLYTYSRQAMMVNIGTYVSLFALSLVVGFIPSVVNQQSPVTLTLTILSNIVAVWFEVAAIIVILKCVKEEKISLNDSLQQGIAMFGRYFLQSLLLGLIAIGSIVLLIVPAFFILPRLLLAQYYLFDQNMGIVESIKASWEATRGHLGKVWGIIGVNIAMMLLIITIIGIPISFYLLIMYSAASAILYFWLIKHGNNKPTDKTVLAGPVSPSK